MKHIFLTGAPGIGKSTLIMRITEKLQDERNLCVCGFRTDEVRQQPGGRTGFDVITVRGSRKPLSRLGEQARGPRVGRYVVDVSSFESLALPELQCALKGSSQDSGVEGGNQELWSEKNSAQGPLRTICVLDEIGKMELFSPSFFPAVRQVLTQSHVLVLGTIPMMKPEGRVLKEVEEVKGRKDVTVVTVTQQNRNMLASELFEMLMQRLKGL